MSQTPQPPENPKAAAKAAKAHAKATRPWYKKKRFMIPLVGVVLIALGAGMSGGGDDGGPKVVEDSAAAPAKDDGDKNSEKDGSADPGTRGQPDQGRPDCRAGGHSLHSGVGQDRCSCWRRVLR